MMHATPSRAKAMVMGIGGAGRNMLEDLLKHPGATSFQIVAVNTDHASLAQRPIPHAVPIGATGLPAVKPEIGHQAALFSTAVIQNMLSDVRQLYAIAGLGGGAGTGATPAIAQIALDMGIDVHIVVSTPWEWEGEERKNQAQKGLAALQQLHCSVHVIDAMKIDSSKSQPEDITFEQACAQVNLAVLSSLFAHAALKKYPSD